MQSMLHTKPPMESTSHLILVDDDHEFRRLLGEDLRRRGFSVEAVADAAALDGLLAQRLPDLIVLDWMLPGEDGPSVLRRLRANPRTRAVPVLMLTARNDEFDRVFGLEIGADDYLTKPFLPRELEARIKAILRRTRSPGTQPSLAPRRWRIGPVEFDTVARTLTLPDGTVQPLTGSEFALLSLFVQHPNEVLTRDYLMRATRGRGADVFDRAIDIAVSRLRAKLESDPQVPRAIRSVRGQGYVLAAPVESIE